MHLLLKITNMLKKKVLFVSNLTHNEWKFKNIAFLKVSFHSVKS